ncbi:MAG: LCP family protein [Cellulosilyticaceae bacterium]
MSKKQPKNKKKGKKSLMKTFFKASFITFLVCFVIVGGLAMAYEFLVYDGTGKNNSSGIGGNKKEPIDVNDINAVNQTLAVFGTDIDGYRTDVIFLVNFNNQTNKVKVISIPRDTRVEWSSQQKDLLRELKGTTRNVSKLNEMTAYAGIDQIRNFTIKHIETLLGIEVDNYVIISLEAFKKIVDAIDGVEVNVPMDMYYQDKSQGLYINLKAGQQKLNGEQAEMLVRYRKGYTNGDEGRIATQQIFLEAFAKKVLSPQIITKMPQIITVLFNSITTDVQLNEVLPYYKNLKGFDLSNLEFYIIPGEANYMSNAWYYEPNKAELQSFSNSIFYEHLMPSEEELNSGAIEIDYNVAIEVLNGGEKKGAAAAAKEMIEQDGYSVQKIGNYGEEYVEKTKIIVKNKAKGMQFKKYYPQAEIIEDKTISADVQIIIGSN